MKGLPPFLRTITKVLVQFAGACVTVPIAIVQGTPPTPGALSALEAKRDKMREAIRTIIHGQQHLVCRGVAAAYERPYTS